MLPIVLVILDFIFLIRKREKGFFELLAFTKTSDWILSGEVAPPPVAYDTHYLCTVSLRGHKKIVKPIR